MSKVDFFISHAREDKESFVRDLANHLIRSGAAVFYDEYSLKLGDSLTQKINEGLGNAKHGILVISRFFMEKKWTNAELQAIFNKHVNDDFKIFIVYHDVSVDEVRNVYPLLADILATNSSKGFEAITGEIFQAAGLKPQFTYAYTTLDNGSGISVEKGFHVLIRFSIPFKGDPHIPKVLFEIGSPAHQHARIRFVIKWNKRLYFEVVSQDYQTIGISISIEEWELGQPHIVIGSCNTQNKKLEMIVDGNVHDNIEYKNLNLPETFFDDGRLMLGCSLDFEYPSFFTLSGFMLGASLTSEEYVKISTVLEDANQKMGR